MDSDTIVGVLMRERAKLFAYIWAIVCDEHLAEDVLQEVSMLAVKKQAEINDEEHLRLWVKQASRNVARNAMRKRQHQPTTLKTEVIDLMEDHWSQYDASTCSHMSQALRECIRGLTPRARRIVKLRYEDGVSGQELAEMLGQKVRSVYTTVSRIHRILADCVNLRMKQEP